jgi:hypothetical protein
MVADIGGDDFRSQPDKIAVPVSRSHGVISYSWLKTSEDYSRESHDNNEQRYDFVRELTRRAGSACDEDLVLWPVVLWITQVRENSFNIAGQVRPANPRVFHRPTNRDL